MKTLYKTTGFALAAAAATMLGACASSGHDEGSSDPIHCVGVNACKGTRDCATATTSCKGQNACKGQGFLSLSKSECDAQGGTVG